MSKDLLVTVLDLTRFERAVGSRDQELLRLVLGEKSPEIAAHDDYFRDWVEGGRYDSIALAITRIINGDLGAPLEPLFQFEHAAAMIADAMGIPLDSEALTEVKEDFWDEVNIAIQHCRTSLGLTGEIWPTLEDVLLRGPLLDIPLASIRLGSGYLTAVEARAADGALPASAAGCRPELEALTWPDEALDAVEAYREWIRAAADAGRGLYLHH